MSAGALQTPFRTGHAGQSAHWYTVDGEAVYGVPNKSKPGEMRPPTVKDARPNGWLPGCTGIIDVAAKRQLENWKQEQVLLACMTSPLLNDYCAKKVSAEEFMQHVYECANAQSETAKNRGTEIHTAIERYFLGEPVAEHLIETAIAAHAAVQNICHTDLWQPEAAFGSTRWGFGGKPDVKLAPGIHKSGLPVIVDFKGKDFDEPQCEADRRKLLKEFCWPEQCMQLAAYDCGSSNSDAPMALLINVFVSRTRSAVVLVSEPWSMSEARTAWNKFKALLTYWQHDRGYYPGAAA